MLRSIASRIPFADRVGESVWAVRVLAEAGLITPIRPDKLARIGERFVRLGTSPALGSVAGAIRHPDDVAIVDEIGELTFAETHARSNRLARALAELGVDHGTGVAIMCRNHRFFIEATMACAKLGASALYLNTSFAKPQLVDVIKREDPKVAICDEEFTDLLTDAKNAAGEDAQIVIAWEDEPGSHETSIESMIRSQSDDSELPAPAEEGRYVILTSGTTGTPKGAQRGSPEGLGNLAAFFSKIPLRAGQTTVIAAPLFHSWGFSHFMLGFPLGCKLILRRRFDPEQTLADLADHKARGLVVVPVMMQRILQVPAEQRERHDLSALEVTAASGSALPGELATKWMDAFGENLYNLYGSTEVAWATIATPEDMRAAPGTAGRMPRGTVIRIVDEDGKEVPKGETGRIFVGNQMSFEGYTGGGDKERIDGLLSSGDVGHFDENERLFVDGRDDEMIVSGGENLFPREVEDLLADHEAVDEAAAIGVDDEEFGKRLRAFVVLNDGADASEGELKAHVKQNLANFKVPREIVFLDELPRNTTGKVVKRELADQDVPSPSDG